MFEFYVKDWAAVAPGLNSKEDWEKWSRGELTVRREEAEPDVTFVPANTRRRMSTLTRLLFAANQQCAPEKETRIVLASRHGEIHRAVELLRLINEHEEISPMSFGLSVHNAGVGLYSMFTGSSAASTAIAAGEDSFLAGLAEAVGFLDEDCKDVLLVMADRILPEEYQVFDVPDSMNFALALLVSKDSGLKVTVRPNTERNKSSVEAAPLGFLRWLLSSERRVTVGSDRFSFCFEKNV